MGIGYSRVLRVGLEDTKEIVLDFGFFWEPIVSNTEGLRKNCFCIVTAPIMGFSMESRIRSDVTRLTLKSWELDTYIL